MHRSRARSALVLVFDLRHDAQRLAEVLLVDADPSVGGTFAVIAFHTDGGFSVHLDLLGECRRHAHRAGKAKAEHFVLDEAVVVTAGWLEDVRCGNASAGHRPAVIRSQQCNLGLRAGETELANIPKPAPTADIAPDLRKARGNLRIAQGLDAIGLACDDRFNAFGRNELDGARAATAPGAWVAALSDRHSDSGKAPAAFCHSGVYAKCGLPCAS